MAPDPNRPAEYADGTDQTTPTAEDLRTRLDTVRARIVDAGGSPDGVRIIGVTKTFPLSVVALAVEAGLGDLGENRAQELATKDKATVDWPVRPIWHFIGGLQRNKVKVLAGRVGLWHTVDRDVLVAEIGRRDPGARVLIQVNTTDEAQKSGCRPEETPSLVEGARAAGLDVLGLMTMGPTGGGDPRPSFERLRVLAESEGLAELSMGMSGDYPLAVTEGATMIRVGSALFGPRPRRND